MGRASKNSQKFFTQRDINDLLCIDRFQFSNAIRNLGISTSSGMYYDSDLIRIYEFIYTRKEFQTVDSKMNFKKMPL